ncbi:MAG TPA: SDR family NAD(P)-dependent oxidoreductase [Candidatus Angelobacter sp.]|nr:SDR family NAD(P)-dependent oxidoreductase [Candidatus Angelobacter sp.]
MNVQGKTVIVTGSGGPGCGRAIALRFAREGANVVITDINDDAGRETRQQIEHMGGRCAYVHADVRREDDVRRLIEFAEQTFKGLSVLVNNASGPDFGPIPPLEHWPEMVATDLLGPMYATRYAVDAMRRGGDGGAIVNISSTSALGFGANSPWPAYDAAKSGILRLTTGLGWMGEKESIRVNCLVPDWVASPQVVAYVDSLKPEERGPRGVPDRLITPNEIAGAVLRLVTDESLAGRVMVWWCGQSPRLIPWRDRGYERLE